MKITRRCDDGERIMSPDEAASELAEEIRDDYRNSRFGSMWDEIGNEVAVLITVRLMDDSDELGRSQ